MSRRSVRLLFAHGRADAEERALMYLTFEQRVVIKLYRDYETEYRSHVCAGINYNCSSSYSSQSGVRERPVKPDVPKRNCETAGR